MSEENVIAFISIKGGVGKTTLALETAYVLANKLNKKVLLIDGNFSAPNIGLYLDLTDELTLHDALDGMKLHNVIYESNGFDVIPASMYYKKNVDPYKLQKLIRKYKQRYDFIILDSSPNYEELKPIVAAADKIFLVTSPDNVTLTTTLKAATLARNQRTPIEGLIVNRIRSPRHEYNTQEIEFLSDIPVMAKIRDHKKMAQSLSQRRPISSIDSSNTISKEIERFATAICGLPEEEGFFQRLNPLRDILQKEKVNREFMRQKFYKSQL